MKILDNLTLIESKCVIPTPTEDQLNLYKLEKDQNKRIEMAYEYYIPKEHLIEDDYIVLMLDMYDAIY